MIEISKSPLNSQSLEVLFQCKDYAVSQEEFSILQDKDTGLLVTSPQPAGEDLDRYYESADYISHTDSQKTLIDQMYQWVKKRALNSKLNLIDRLAPEKGNLMDIGCGTGDFMVACKKNSWSTTGIEPNEKARKLGLEKLESISGHNTAGSIFQDIKEYRETVEKDKGETKFDVITLWHVLEHVPVVTEYVKELHNLLADTGTLVVAVPNHKSYDAKIYGKFWAAYDVPRHLWHFSKRSISLLFSQVQMELIEIKPMKWDAFYVSLLSEKYKNGKVNYLKAFYNGLVSNRNGKVTGEYSSLIYVLKKKKGI
jgi:2-polyprenyl-3-methyl-5-hydroxy-6-metoxy-1,4-benzoquinol methylase